VAESILEDHPDMVYSDEVLVAPAGAAVLRYAYRPAFSKEYLRSHPYIVHLVGFRTQLLRELGGFDESLRISQDYDLILRVAEKARTIVHIPEILYQWRLHASSAGTQRMDEVMRTSKAVLQRHLERSGETGTVHDGVSFNLFEVRYPLDPGLRVAIIVPTKNHGVLLRQCIDSIRATVKGVAYDIVVVDHESDDRETVEYLASVAASGIKVLRYEGIFNFSAINNWAVAQLAAPYSHYLFCNNDIEAKEEGWLERMLELGQQPAIAIVGAKLLYPDGKTIQHGGVCVGAYGAAEHYGKRLRYPGDPVEAGFGELLQMNHEVAAVTAACMLIRQEAFREVGGFDEAILVGFGDVDLCLRIGAKGYRILFCPHAQLLHHESYTRGVSSSDPHPADSALYRFKWREYLQAGDPYYSPGLSLFSTNWALKQPLHCDFGVRRRIVRRASGRDDVSFSPAQAG
jgi:GT2 family glycosyltransferase